MIFSGSPPRSDMDYCTLFPEGWWAHCCAAHDAAYAAQVARDVADKALLQCVAASATSSPALAVVSAVVGVVMFVGVRLAGRFFYKDKT